jgi:hypothetical protein
MGSCVIKIEGFQFPTSNTSCEFFNLFMKKWVTDGRGPGSRMVLREKWRRTQMFELRT